MPESKTDPQKPDPQKPEPTEEEAAENAFFDKMEGRLDSWFDKKIESLRGTGNSRTGGRATLPKILSDAFFGPTKTE